MAVDHPHHQFADAEAFSAFLEQASPELPGIRLRIAKKTSMHTTVSYSDAVDVALCHGWIDGRRNALDDDFFLQTFTPRRTRSLWSKVNRLRVEALIEAGRMRPGGLAEVERAKADGRWEAAYDSQRTIEVSPELAEALAANPEAQAFFATLSSQNRYAILFRLHNLKRAETRTRRIADFVAMLARHETLHPQ
ncbi:YdeI/OmpD-associated family protein [Herbiconiux liangxiaofengii]|uniref:YdeI/OmpD-associated family protein n=1 Tax=Herbiconiux liangxiaofengii TaxID=3342795 RepID=UPI0035B6F040